MVRLKGGALVGGVVGLFSFQFLMVRLKGELKAPKNNYNSLFQFLMVRLKVVNTDDKK